MCSVLFWEIMFFFSSCSWIVFMVRSRLLIFLDVCLLVCLVLVCVVLLVLFFSVIFCFFAVRLSVRESVRWRFVML